MVKQVVFRFSELVARKERIEQRKWSYPDIIEATGLTDYAIRGIKTGRKTNLDLEEVAILCEFFNCQPGDLYAFVDAHEASKEEDEFRRKP